MSTGVERDDGAAPGAAALRRSPEMRGAVDPPCDHEHANDHLALLYEGRDEQFAAVCPFVRQGLERGEQCLYIAHENSRDEVLESLRAGGVDVDRALESGALRVTSVGETYMSDGTFDLEASLALLEDAVDAAADDFAGIRFTAEESWLLEAEMPVAEFMTLESRVNELIRASDVVALCQYDRERFPPSVVEDVIETHPHLVAGNVVSDNVYYAPPESFSEGDPDQRIDRMVRTLTDRTEARAALRERERDLEATVERLRQSNDRLAQFAYAASHDLQEPLRMVSSYLRLLENDYADELDEDARTYVDFAIGGADQMREMIDGLLAFTEAQRTDAAFEAVDCEAVLDRARADLRERIEETGAVITADPLPTVAGDADQLAQVFYHLLANAIIYTREDPPVVHVGVERRPDRWEFAVTDEGIGIDPAKTDRIFEVFKRLHREEEFPGTGIGLSLCQEVVESHGGEIEVESTPGEGSTFRFTLPRREID